MTCALVAPKQPTPAQVTMRAGRAYPWWFQFARELRGQTIGDAATALSMKPTRLQAIELGIDDFPKSFIQRAAEQYALPESFFQRRPREWKEPFWICGSRGVDDGIAGCVTCGMWAEYLCDFPMGKGKTCDAPLCEQHRVHQGGEMRTVDFCAAHAIIAQGMVTTA